MEEVYCYAEEVPNTYSDVFKDSYVEYCTLYVPKASIDKYKAADQWKEFESIKAIEDAIISGTPEEPETKECTIPVISFADGKLKFHSDTPNASYHYDVTTSSTISGVYSEGESAFDPEFTITAYATADGYSQSKTATKQIKFDGKIPEPEIITVEVHDTIEVEKIVEVEVPVEIEKLVETHDTIYVTEIDTVYVTETETIYIYDDSRSDISTPDGQTITFYIRDGIIHIENAPLNSTVYVYSETGEMLESRRVYENELVIALPRNAIYIIKTKDKVFKVKL